ncbi:hypothetical protein BDP55DRAFT_635796 [Colletotrichum godetiae]|uniref:Uncharacterized protein n=1 Tax=Colletotrichum godetiae TaxID=1209918 RepID=A0AAJ0ACT3_9PEZI|nr:uncharacterized protein BDP55DRAFT_635796 [Colletotrichum godetiae]KAK1671550.1 hypothetical protein BDP55DRAFT_635796 [Colletotrichum godetiae]
MNHKSEASELLNPNYTHMQPALQKNRNGDPYSEPRHTTMTKMSDQKMVKAFGFRFQNQTRTVLKNSHSHSTQEVSNTSEIETYTFGHSSFSYRIELHWSMSTLSPMVYALAVRHALPADKDIKLVDKMLRIMSYGDLPALQDLLSTRTITLGIMLGDRTLFESAAVCSQPSLCRFLAQQNLELCLDEKPDHWAGLMVDTSSNNRRRLFETDEIVQLTQVPRLMRFRPLASCIYDLESLVVFYNRCRVPALDEMEKNAFLNAVWDMAVYLLLALPLRSRRCPFPLAVTTKIAGFDVPVPRRYVDPHSRAYEVRNEFKKFGPLLKGDVWLEQSSFVLNIENAHGQQHVAMKFCQVFEENDEEWPFVLNFIRDYDAAGRHPFNWNNRGPPGDPSAGFLYAREFMQERFNRKQMKKLYRSGYLKRENRPLKIPEAWPDSDW